MIKVFFVFWGWFGARRPGLVWGRGACGRLSARIFMCGAATAVMLLQGCGRAGRAGCFVFITVFYSFMSFRAVRTSSCTAISSADSSASNFPWWMP